MLWNVLRLLPEAGPKPYTPVSREESLAVSIETAEKMVEWLFMGDVWHWETYPQEDPTLLGALVLDHTPTRAVIIVIPNQVGRA